MEPSSKQKQLSDWNWNLFWIVKIGFLVQLWTFYFCALFYFYLNNLWLIIILIKVIFVETIWIYGLKEWFINGPQIIFIILFWSDSMVNNLVRSINILSIHHGTFEAKFYVKYCSNKYTILVHCRSI